ncbi:MAG: AAA-associated domain-containing protein [Rhabdochlamydiaceae bacterium]|nr:AAA-associated domain-containing protein [Rhabdochlamydiaceae bacterium]
MGAESHQRFDHIVIASEAAEMLNFIEISHKIVTLTEAGKKYLTVRGHERKNLWKDRLLTIPLFIKTQQFLQEAPHRTANKEQLLQLLMKAVPHQDGQKQFNLWMNWGRRGDLFVYHSKTKEITAKESSIQ